MIFAFKITPLHKKVRLLYTITVVAILSLPNDEYFGGQSEYYKLFFVCYMLYYVIVIYMKIIFISCYIH